MRLYEILLTESNNPIDNINGAGATSNNRDVDYFGNRVMMKPSTFLKLAAPDNVLSSKNGLKQHIENGGKIASPMLYIDMPTEWLEGDFSKQSAIDGHEGRNRMSAIKELYGDIEIETHLFVRYRRNRHITDEILARLNGALITETGEPIKGPFFNGNYIN